MQKLSFTSLYLAIFLLGARAFALASTVEMRRIYLKVQKPLQMSVTVNNAKENTNVLEAVTLHYTAGSKTITISDNIMSKV